MVLPIPPNPSAVPSAVADTGVHVLPFSIQNHDVPVEFEKLLVCPSPSHLLARCLLGVVERDDAAAASQTLLLGEPIHEQGKINNAVAV